MVWVSLICLVIFIFMAGSLFMKNTDVFSPARLFIIIWSMVLGLANLKFSRYQITWTSFSWIMIIISLFSVLCGMFVVYVINLNKPIKTIISIRSLINDGAFDSGRLFRIIILLFLAYIISYIVTVLIIGYVPLFTKYPGVARNDWGVFGFGLFVQSFPSIIFAVILYFLITKGERNKKILLFLVLAITFVTYAFLLQRYYLIFAVLLSMVAMYYLTNALRVKNTLIISLIILILLFSVTFVRLTGAITNYLYYLSDMKYSIKYAFMTEPYMYVVMNVENLANAIQHLDKFSYGTFSFDFIFALTGIKHQMSQYLGFVEFPNLISNNYNTYTMFFVYYRDFGILGLGLIPFILGVVFSTAYYKMRTFPSIHTISIYAVFAFVIIFSFFVPIITFLHFVFNLILISYFTKAVGSKAIKHSLNPDQ